MQKNRSALFLTEFLVAVFLFCLSSAVCVRIFAAAHLKEAESARLNFASVTVSAAAESVKACGRDLTALASYLEAQETDGVLTVFYDGDFFPCEEKNAVYRMTVSPLFSDTLLTAVISFQMKEDTICSITVKKYLGGAA